MTQGDRSVSIPAPLGFTITLSGAGETAAVQARAPGGALTLLARMDAPHGAQDAVPAVVRAAAAPLLAAARSHWQGHVQVTVDGTDGPLTPDAAMTGTLNDVLSAVLAQHESVVDAALLSRGLWPVRAVMQRAPWLVHHTGGGSYALVTRSGHGEAYLMVTDEDGQIPVRADTFVLGAYVDSGVDDPCVALVGCRAGTMFTQVAPAGERLF